MSFPVSSSHFNGFSDFMRMAQKYPVLSAEEERENAFLFYENNNQDSFKKLVLSNLRFVGNVAKKLGGYGVPLIDLVQEGTIGLMKAVKKFDPTIGTRLASFSIFWIKSEMNKYITDNYSIFKIGQSKPERKLFFNKSKIKSINKHALSQDEAEMVADELNLTVKDIRSMESRLSSSVISFDTPINEEDSLSTIGEMVSYEDSNLSEQFEAESTTASNSTLLLDSISKLDNRSQIILQRRWLAEKKSTLQELSEEFSVSIERIRQIEKKALSELKDLMPQPEF